jgi:hypothetical protein
MNGRITFKFTRVKVSWMSTFLSQHLLVNFYQLFTFFWKYHVLIETWGKVVVFSSLQEIICVGKSILAQKYMTLKSEITSLFFDWTVKTFFYVYWLIGRPQKVSRNANRYILNEFIVTTKLISLLVVGTDPSIFIGKPTPNNFDMFL